MDSARLRKAFKYPADDEDNSHEDMDEEEQEHLLENLESSETSTNAIYTLLFTGLPLVVILPYLWYLSRTTGRSMTLLCLLGITSLISSAYIMYMIPVSTPLGSLSPSSISQMRTTPSAAQRHNHAYSQTSFFLTSDESPINQYLRWLNVFISALLFLSSWAFWSKKGAPEGFWLFLLFPGLIFGMVVLVRRSMAEVQSGLTDLRGMRYDYKGA